jgi:hypothetical protein
LSKTRYTSDVETYELASATYCPFVTPLKVPVAVNVFCVSATGGTVRSAYFVTWTALAVGAMTDLSENAPTEEAANRDKRGAPVNVVFRTPRELLHDDVPVPVFVKLIL